MTPVEILRNVVEDDLPNAYDPDIKDFPPIAYFFFDEEQESLSEEQLERCHNAGQFKVLIPSPAGTDLPAVPLRLLATPLESDKFNQHQHGIAVQIPQFLMKPELASGLNAHILPSIVNYLRPVCAAMLLAADAAGATDDDDELNALRNGILPSTIPGYKELLITSILDRSGVITNFPYELSRDNNRDVELDNVVYNKDVALPAQSISLLEGSQETIKSL